MKKIFSVFRKVLLVVSIILLITSSVAFGFLYYKSSTELDKINQLYNRVQENLNVKKEESQVTIDDLKKSFQDLNNQVNDLKLENSKLLKEIDLNNKNKMSSISGSIIAFVSSGEEAFSQYQLVCAENSVNTNIKYCTSVSALEQNYEIQLPSGKYFVSASIILKDGSMSKTKAYYTEYVRCIQEKQTSECKPELSKTLAEINLTENKKIVKVDPKDLQYIK